MREGELFEATKTLEEGRTLTAFSFPPTIVTGAGHGYVWWWWVVMVLFFIFFTIYLLPDLWIFFSFLFLTPSCHLLTSFTSKMHTAHLPTFALCIWHLALLLEKQWTVVDPVDPVEGRKIQKKAGEVMSIHPSSAYYC